ncbi:ring-cleaving dioxygenase [Jeotgalibaca caeni]|uniref:ring-cleaving dioxygenase n=1 Tax=Jeotgalibaca caeni TaxID=3028623 RepID=UPI00237DD62B|nr:ring-cleaving dioxygenase [Jeotgalibaca caeni]MDE1548358.1 ring-cleaving dioxygenase [Jeotgalibaca caeni]
MKTAGIHHISAIVGNAQENVDFYAGILGLRLVKKTVNFDDPGTYHLYFGNEGGEPGTLITFFPWNRSYRGKVGGGQVGITSYAVPMGALPFWEKRLSHYDIPFDKVERFGETYLQFVDVHGLILEIVERSEGKENPWTFNGVTPEVGIKGFAGTVFFSLKPEETIKTVEEVMDLNKLGEEGDVVRYRSSSDRGNTIDIKKTAVPKGRMGIGTVHHIAWRAKDEQELKAWQDRVQENDLQVTEVKDRNYFKAIYYREHGDILFEIATDGPGFAHDESYEKMGSEVMLPPAYENRRDELVNPLLPIEVREV